MLLELHDVSKSYPTGEGLSDAHPLPRRVAFHHQAGVVQVAALRDEQAEVLGAACRYWAVSPASLASPAPAA